MGALQCGQVITRPLGNVQPGGVPGLRKGQRAQGPLKQQGSCPTQTQQWTLNPKVYPFAPQDHVVSDAKHFAGPCYTCGSGKHWLRDCPKQGEYEELCKKRIVKGPLKAYKVAMFTVKASRDPNMVNPTSEEEGFA